MPIWEVTAYYADCDECEWGEGEFSDREFAEQQLNEHIREVH